MFATRERETRNRDFLRRLGAEHQAADAMREPPSGQNPGQPEQPERHFGQRSRKQLHLDASARIGPNLRKLLLNRNGNNGSNGDAKGTQNFFAGNWQGFSGGHLDRTNEEWNPGTVGPNRLHLKDGRILRERARDLAINNPYALSAINSYVANVIGKGISPKPQFENSGDRNAWSMAWNVWGGNTAVSDGECDLSGVGSIYELQDLFLREVIEAGGCLLHFVDLPTSRGRRLPFAIEMIPEERLADEMDTPMLVARQGNQKTANQIVRGVEIEAGTGRPLAYWVRPSIPNDATLVAWEPIRLPAEECSYGFLRRRIGAQRGVTLLYAAIVWLWRLGYYVDAELLASQMKSNWAYMVGTDSDPDFDWPDVEDCEGGTTDYYGNVIERTQAGQIWRGRPGDKITAVGPNVPGSDSIAWIKLIEQSIAIAVDLSMFELTRNASDANFSSLRAATNADRSRFRRMQQFVVRKFNNPVWRHFATSAVRVGANGFPRPSAFTANYDDWLSVNWLAPGWLSVNPLDDAQANDIRLANHTITREQIIGEEGGDWEDSFAQQGRELVELDANGLVVAQPASDANATGNMAPRTPIQPSQQTQHDTGGPKR